MSKNKVNQGEAMQQRLVTNLLEVLEFVGMTRMYFASNAVVSKETKTHIY